MTTKCKSLVLISLCLAGTMMLTACEATGSNTSSAAASTSIIAISSVLETTKELMETAAVTALMATPVSMDTVVMLPVPATYASLFDGTRIYSDGSRTVVLKTLVKGDQVTITGTSGQYGVTAEGSFVNLHLMIVVVTVTPTTAEITAVPTDPAAATTKAPAATTKATTAAVTKVPAATTKATSAATTAAPPVETSPPVTTTAAYTPNCDNIRSLIVSNLQSRGYWFPDAASIGGGSASVTTNYFYSDEKFAEGFLGKFTNIDKLGIGVISVSVWLEDGYVCFSYTACKYPTA